MAEFYPGDSVLIRQPSEQEMTGVILYKLSKRQDDSLTFYVVWTEKAGIIVGIREEYIQLISRYMPIAGPIPNGSLVFAKLTTMQGIGTVTGQNVVGLFGWPNREYHVTFNKNLTCTVNNKDNLVVLRYPQLPVRQPIQSALKTVLTKIKK